MELTKAVIRGLAKYEKITVLFITDEVQLTVIGIPAFKIGDPVEYSDTEFYWCPTEALRIKYEIKRGSSGWNPLHKNENSSMGLRHSK